MNNAMSNNVLKHGSLFSGIGGFDLAAEWMGWENVFHCEWNEFGQRILKHYWPKAISYEDITKTDFSIHRGEIDILTGGFPCQPYSQAGKRLGKEDDRHLWPEMLRAIREIAPKYVVGENVSGLLNWNGGLVFNEVQTDLEAEGYEVQPCVLPAASVNAPHRRDRVWFIAYANGAGEGNNHGTNERTSSQIRREEKRDVSSEFCSIRDASDSNGKLYKGWGSKDRPEEAERYFSASLRRNPWQNFPTQSPICSGNDGISNQLDGITFSKWRNESIKAYGNAIVPQVAFEMFKALIKTEDKLNYGRSRH